MKVQQDQSVESGFALDEPDGEESTLRVRLGAVVGPAELALLAAMFADYWPQIMRAGAKLTQVL